MKQNKVFKILVCILAVVIAMSATSLISLAAAWTGGYSSVAPSRTSDGFYLLKSAEDLAWFARQINSDAGNVTMKGRLIEDIYLNDIENNDYSQNWTPIADYSATGRVFSGIFDGNGFTIYGMKVNSDKDYQGLFGYLSGAQIRNVKIANSYITGVEYVGGIAGISDNRTSITSCTVDATITGDSRLGGITGYIAMNSNITYCSFTGSINATGHHIGGITGCAFSECVISQSYNSGSVYSTGKYVGGITGTNSGSYILSCYNMGNIKGDLRVGGISGNNVGDIASCYNASKVQSISTPAGLTGAIAAYYYASKISNCYYNSDLFDGKEDNAVSLTTDELKRLTFIDRINGSLGDYYYDYLLINNGYPILSWQVDQNIWDGTISEPEMSADGKYYIITTPRELAWFAALVNGTLPNGVQNSSANAMLTKSVVMNAGSFGEGSNVWTPIGYDGVEFSGSFYGNGFTIRGLYIPDGSTVGLFGQISSDALVSNIIIAESYVNGESCVAPVAGCSFGKIERAKIVYTTVNGYDYVGGIVGENYGEVIDSSSIYSEVTGVESVGGIAGINYGGSLIEICCSFNTVNGENYVGGIVGDNMADVTNTFNVGSINAEESYAGGIAGKTDGCTIKDCYNTGVISGESKVGGIAGQIDSASLVNTYTIGKILGKRERGAVVGANYNGTVVSCYYDKDMATDETGKAVFDTHAKAMRTTQMTNSKALDNLSGFDDSDWVATADSTYFVYYPQLMSFATTADYDLYEISIESVTYLKEGLVCKVTTSTENSYFATLEEAFAKIGDGAGIVELTDSVTIDSTSVVYGDVTVIPTSESDIIIRGESMFDKPIVVKDGATLNFGADDASYAVLTVDGNNVTDILEENFAESMITVEKGGTFNSYDTIAVNHTGLNGGYINNSGDVNLYSGEISDCVAFQAGGAVFNKGEINIFATRFVDNNSKLYGGAFFNAGGKVFINTDTEFTGNTAGEGGAVYINSGEFNLQGGSLYSNSATSYGGAFYVSDKGKLKLYDGSIYENVSQINGSGIYNTGTVEFFASGYVDSSNDVYLPEGEKITMSALSVYSSSIVTITPEKYIEGKEVVNGVYNAMNSGLCSVSSESETQWHVNSTGRLASSQNKTVLTASYFYADSVGYSSFEDLFENLEKIEEELRQDDNFNEEEFSGIPAIITLVDDTVVTETITIKYNTIIQSDGIAHTISAAEGFDGPLFEVVDGAMLTFGSSTDKYTDGVLYINGNNIVDNSVIDANDGSVKIYSGTVIFGGNGIESAVKSANLIEMHGGEIRGNKVNVGAVYINGGTFNFFSGTIFDNDNVGVYVDGIFNIHDGAYVDKTNVVYLTDGRVINVISPEPEVNDETGEIIPADVVIPEMIACVDFERYYLDESILNTEKSDNPGKYSGKFTLADTTYYLDEFNVIRGDYFALNYNASLKIKYETCVYGFSLDVYTAKSLKLQFKNKNVGVVDRYGNFLEEDEMVGTGDMVVLMDNNKTIYRTIPILIYGDINADGDVDGQDAFIVFMYLAGFFDPAEFTDIELEAMDVNHDGHITQEDAEIIEKFGAYEGSIKQQ